MENGYTISSFTANNDAQSALLTGKVDAWVIDDLTAADMVKAYNAENGDTLVILEEALTTEPYAFAFCFGSEDLVEEINGIIAELRTAPFPPSTKERNLKREQHTDSFFCLVFQAS